jgi:Vitamin K-dependent gamma-carboxylase
VSGLRGWAAPAVPLGRVAVLRTVLYLFVLFDAAFVTPWAFSHGDTSTELYHPVLLRQWLHLPAPSHGYVRALVVVLAVSALVAATGRLPRLAGWTCCAAMLDWWSNAFSYSKVDHDHFALVVALAVLPTVGRARWRDRDASEAAGWALRCVQVGVVATYFLSAVAKMRFGGWGWAAGATFTWAFVRRGTGLAQLMLQWPWLVSASQWALLALETLSPVLLFVRGRLLYAAVALFAGFHLTTYLLIRIHFLPLVVCLGAFLPVERLVRRRVPAPAAAERRSRAARASAVEGSALRGAAAQDAAADQASASR